MNLAPTECGSTSGANYGDPGRVTTTKLNTIPVDLAIKGIVFPDRKLKAPSFLLRQIQGESTDMAVLDGELVACDEKMD